MKTVTFMNEKGGVGKTTLSTHLAALMAALGLRVLVVDAAPQGHATISLGLQKEAGIYNWLVRGATLQQVIRVPPNLKALTIPGEPFKGKLFVLPSNEETIGIPAQVDSYALQEGLEELRGSIDLIIIDSDPATSALATILYLATDAVVIPTQADALSIDGLIATINRVQNYRHRNISIMGIATNFYDHRTLVHRKNYSDLLAVGKQRGWAIWHPIKMRTAFREASNLKQMVYTLDTDSANAAARDLYKVADQFRQGLGYV